MAEQKTLGAVVAAPEGAGKAVLIHKRYTFQHRTVNPWHRVGAVADRVVDRLLRPTP